ncbi:MAG: hypothetical protein FWC14_01855 [Candidatus Bathyarchaeota archaeon]|uniref:zinc-ribbon domain-containing protein n=2 Tax=Candidatus Bathycorpusculum sp. TaxID=2994959 RepID=UPI00281D2D10|nr:hypothetical protein [Candidatus Termiticorpusculum sp.]MCL2292945.1 hypothetical protein [Candidatus Termiticorpusculum sp.]
MNATVKNLRCTICSAPISIPKNSKDHVKCPYCNTDCILDGITKNSEIAAKENINSGLPLSASSATLHKKLVTALSETPSLPLDIFEKGKIVREERYCVPAYCFYCNGSTSFTYEVGNERTQTHYQNRDNDHATHIEWTPGNSTAYVSSTFFASGNKKTALQIKELYTHLDPNKLVDIEDLEFPADVVTYNYDMLQPVAFTEYVIPLVDQMLEKKAKESIAKLNYRNFATGGNNIQKDVTRVFLGLYHIVLKYNDQEYAIWVTGDGEKIINEGMPQDMQLVKDIDAKKQAMEQAVTSIPVPKTTSDTLGLWGSLICGIILLFVFWPLALVCFAGTFIFWLIKSKKLAPYKAECTNIRTKFQSEINDLENREKNVIQQFNAQKKGMHGIYEKEVTGDENAFPPCQTRQTINTETNYCPNCGTQTTTEKNFCINCGKKIRQQRSPLL